MIRTDIWIRKYLNIQIFVTPCVRHANTQIQIQWQIQLRWKLARDPTYSNSTFWNQLKELIGPPKNCLHVLFWCKSTKRFFIKGIEYLVNFQFKLYFELWIWYYSRKDLAKVWIWYYRFFPWYFVKCLFKLPERDET